MKLKTFYGKQVNIHDSNGVEWNGLVTDYVYPEDNESGEESIIVDCKNKLTEFEQSDIKKIEER